GGVEMRRNYALEPDEVAAGYVLTCQSMPASDAVTVDFDA
ncbi:MAG: phenylacetic acid degradation protein, partial [Blastococcus sp.]|nr:phenylacetic acid degradation protein [Blastococcus sp.]